MVRRHWEDFKAGEVIECRPHLVTADEIKEFAAEFDPQPMHLDEAAAGASMLGGLAASGWHTCAMFMRMLADDILAGTASMGAPGVDECKWLRPVRPGDRLTLRATVLETRASKSRPEMGLVKVSYEMRNTAGERVMTLVCSNMFGRREPGGTAAR